MKKSIFILACAVFALSVTACGNNGKTTSMADDTTMNASAAPTVAAATAGTDNNNTFSDHNGNGVTDSQSGIAENNVTNENGFAGVGNGGTAVGDMGGSDSSGEDMANKARSMTEDVTDAVKDGASDAGNDVKDAAEDTMGGIRNITNDVMDTGINVANDMRDNDAESEEHKTLGDVDGDGFVKNNEDKSENR